ncbi:MAG: efflux RND transporter periplasmic adaptor subunit [Pseudomonadota bacterium]
MPVLGGLSLLLSTSVTANEAVETPLDCLVEPSMIVDLSAPEPGQLDAVFVRRNDVVKQGDFIAKLESSLEIAAVKLAEHSVNSQAQLELRQQSVEYGQRTLERNRTLMKTSSVSRQQFDKVETEYEISRLQLKDQRERAGRYQLELDRARAALARRSIQTPISGVISERYKNEGEYLEGQPIVQIARLEPLHVTVIAPLSYLPRVREGAEVPVRILAGDADLDETARVTSIDRVADAASNTFGVQLTLANADLRIPGGVRCQVSFD